MPLIAAIAAATVLEAVRARVGWLLVLAALAGFGFAAFIGALTLTETRQVQAVLLAAVRRIVLVLVVAAFATASVAREASDRLRDLLFALPHPRLHYLAGKWAGLATVASAGALVVTLPLLPFAPAGQCMLWGATLACEAGVVAAFALFAAGGRAGQVAPLAATVAFYALARAVGSMELLAGQGGAATTCTHALALLLPRLDAFARGAWLTEGGGDARALALCVGQGALYVLLLGAAANVDLQRREPE
jgi:ABC-type Na+ efflux pump permease subunit